MSSISVHISSSELLLSSSLPSGGPFFLDFQVPSGKDVSSTTLVHEIVDFSQNLDNPFLEVLFLLKPRRDRFLLHFQGQSVPWEPSSKEKAWFFTGFRVQLPLKTCIFTGV